MRAGKLRHLGTIIRDVVLSKDEYGQEVTGAEAFALTYVGFRPLSERELYQAREIHADVTHVLQMRHIPGITAEMRLLYDNRIFQFLGPPLNLEERDIEIEILAMERTSETPSSGDLSPSIPLTDLLAHYDASDTDSVTPNTDLSDVDLLEDDLSQSQRDMSGSFPRRPTYRTNIRNGLNVINFNGVSELLSRSDDSDFEVDDFSMFIALGRNGTGDELFVAHQANIVATEFRGFGFDVDSGLLRCFISSNSTTFHETTSSSSMPSGWHLISAIKSGQTVMLYIDGQQVGQKTDAPTSINFTGTPKNNSIGSHVLLADPFDGDFGQYAIYGVGVDNEKRDLIHNLFASKWGISI